MSSGSKGTDDIISFETCNEQFFTLDSFSFSPANHLFIPYQSPQTALSVLSDTSPYSSQGSQSHTSDPGCHYGGASSSSVPMWTQLDINQLLLRCAEAASDGDLSTAGALMDALEQIVSISGEPVQRLGTYMLEGLRARLERSGSGIYKSLRCTDPASSSEMMSYMQVLYQMCPYWKFAYVAANAVIREAVEDEDRIHIVDFQIAQGSQWADLIKALALRHHGPPHILRVAGVDDAESTHARGGGLRIVGEVLSELAASCDVPFEFHEASMTDVRLLRENLVVIPGEAMVFNFPYVLYHVPDESVNTDNYRDKLLRTVRGLSPKVLTLVEQESNTNTSAFMHRFRETLDYYTAMFESIDVARARDDSLRLNAEMHCMAKDIISMIGCEGAERVERHELLAKWRARFSLAGFAQRPLSPAVADCVKDVLKDVLKDFQTNYSLEEDKGGLYLGWKNRAMVTCSAWR